MDKIGIITIVNGNNYGNVLQNYALQKTIKKIGFASETIDRQLSNSTGSIFSNCRMSLNAVLKKCKGDRLHAYKVNRIRAFQNFRRKYIKYSSFHIKGNKFPPEREKEYDTFVFGSDQIWNLKFAFVREECDVFFGKFAAKHKKIAYAGSFGTVNVPNEYQACVSGCLKDFRSVSVREYAGKELCAQLGIKSEVVPDPTLLLSVDEWREIEKCPFGIKKNYMLTYFLGEISDQIRTEIERYAEERGLELINLNHSIRFCRTERDLDLFSAAPDEFLWLIDHCTAFVTDSFHGSVFSLIFGKPFQVIERVANEKDNNMSSRIVTLLEMFCESHRLKSLHIDAEMLQTALGMKNSQIHGDLRKQGFQYLQTQLSMKGDLCD